MFTSKFATNRAVLRVLLYGWHEHELPSLKFKFKSRNAGSLQQVLSKLASDVHLLIVAEDSVDAATREILMKGLYAEHDSCFFVDSNTVKKDFGLNGHTLDDDLKNILVYGFEDPLEPEIVPIFRPAASGTLKDALAVSGFRYAAAVAVESRPIPDDGEVPAHARVVSRGQEKRMALIDDETAGFLKDKALLVEGQGRITYYIMPPSTVAALSN